MSVHTCFVFAEDSHAESVEVAGSFNNWIKVKMEKLNHDEWSIMDPQFWRVTLELPPGQYQYKFFVDNTWIHDKEKPTTQDNFGGLNNVIIVEGNRDMKVALKDALEADYEKLNKLAPWNGITALAYYAAIGEKDACQALIEGGADANKMSEDGSTPLFMAIRQLDEMLIELDKENMLHGEPPLLKTIKKIPESGYIEIVKMLLSAGADAVKTKDSCGKTGLFYAVSEGHTEIVKAILEKEINLSGAPCQAEGEWTPIMESIQKGYTEICKLLIDGGAALDNQNDDGKTALMIAVKNEKPDFCKMLIEARANVNSRDREGKTALIHAVLHDAQNICKMLIQAGADVELTDDSHNSPLLEAAYEDRENIFKMLMEAGANVDTHDCPAGKLLRVAVDNACASCDNKNIKIVEMILLAASNIDIQDSIYIAANNGATDIIKMIIEKTPYMDAYVFRYTLNTAALYGFTEICKLLIEERADPLKGDKYSLTRAATEGHIDIVKMFLEKLPNINVDNYKEKPSLMAVTKERYVEICKSLVDALEGAIDQSHTEISKLLIEAGALKNGDLQQASEHSNSSSNSSINNSEHISEEILDLNNIQQALLTAVRRGLTDIVKMIIEKAPNTKKHYSLMAAIDKGNLEIFKLLIEAGADMDEQTHGYYYGDYYRYYYGDTPLINAIKHGEVEMCKLLVEAGADLDKKNEDGYTALIIASHENCPDVCDMLLKAGAKPLMEAYAELIKRLVLDTMDAIMRIWVEKIDEIETPQTYEGITWAHTQQPECVLRLKSLPFNLEEAWLMMVKVLVEVVPLEHPVGAITIALLMKQTTKYDIVNYDIDNIDVFQVMLQMASSFEANDKRHGNISILISCIVVYLAHTIPFWVDVIEKFQHILTPDMLAYLFGNLNAGAVPEASTFSLLALEFLAYNEGNKGNHYSFHEKGDREKQNKNAEIVKKRFSEFSPIDHPLLRLEKLAESENFAERQLGFCAKWYLDNLWTIDNQDARTPNIMGDININVKLIPIDKSEHRKIMSKKSRHLKVGSNGLELFNNGLWFETAISSVQVLKGSWYYEVTLVTSGLMQIGWASKQCEFMQEFGGNAYAVGDDKYSLSYDGCRQVLWFDRLQPLGEKPLGWVEEGRGTINSWKPGDVVGSLIDLKNKKEIIFSLNGVIIRSEPYREFLWSMYTSYDEDPGIFAAISLMSFQQCRVNFGGEPFKHPPEGIEFKPLNEATTKLI